MVSTSLLPTTATVNLPMRRSVHSNVYKNFGFENCSHLHVFRVQPLIAVSLTGMRFSRQNLGLTHDLSSRKNTFVSLDSLELTDLLRHGDSPFRVMVTSSQVEHSNHGLFSFEKQIEVDAMLWQSYCMVASEWGFQMSLSMEIRHDAIRELTPPGTHFDRSSGQRRHFMAFQSVLHDNGLHCIDIDIQNMTAQWNPSTIIACQRFLGRLKKATLSILENANSARKSEFGKPPPPKETPKSCHIIFSVNAKLESICICLSECLFPRPLCMYHLLL